MMISPKPFTIFSPLPFWVLLYNYKAEGGHSELAAHASCCVYRCLDVCLMCRFLLVSSGRVAIFSPSAVKR